MRSRALSAVALEGILLGLAGLNATRPEPQTAVLLLAVGVLALEVGAVPVPGFGFFSSAVAPCLALALLPSGGTGVAAAVLLAGVLLGALLRGSSLLESLAELVPITGGLAAAGFFRAQPALAAGVGVAAYLALASLWPRSLALATIRDDRVLAAWLQNRSLTDLQRTSAALMGPALALLAGINPWACLVLLPGLLALRQSARINTLHLELLERENLHRDQQLSRAALSQTREQLASTSRALEHEARERQFLQHFTYQLANSPDLEGVLACISETTRRVVRTRMVVIYPLQGEAPSLVEECRRTGQVRVAGGNQAALPLQHEGVLYVERAAGEFSEEERETLLDIAGAGGLGIQSARALGTLRTWVDRLAFLLEGARELSGGLSLERMLERLERLLAVTVPHEAGAVALASGRGGRRWPREHWTPERAGKLPGWCELAARAAGPVELEGGLACALVSEHAVLGVVVLEGSFTAEQRDVLSLIAFQAGTVLQNLSLHQEVVQAQAQLVQSSKMAAVGQLAAGVAHELNTPLCAALGALEMLELSLEGVPQAARHLAAAEKAGNRCKDIIAKLLYYARDAAGSRAEAHLDEIVRDTLELLGKQLRYDGLEVRSELQVGLPPVRVNCNELQQVVSNLLVNARDATLAAPVKRILLQTGVSRPGHVFLRVSDTGPGMADEVKERIFEPFFTTKPVGQGTGLGLSVSREIVLRHAGALTVASTPGNGAVFTVELPQA